MKSQDRKEEKLFDELETLYQQVAESEKSEADSEQMKALQGYYESLQVSPDASLETIKETYKRLVDFWDPGQFAINPSLREKAEMKLAEITHAYEKILAFRQRESGPPSAEPPLKLSEQPDLSAPDQETGPPFLWGKILLGGAASVVVVLAVFFWPPLYHYDTIPSGNQTYQVRTNRITGSMTYFDGEKWNTPPNPGSPTLCTPVPSCSSSSSTATCTVGETIYTSNRNQAWASRRAKGCKQKRGPFREAVQPTCRNERLRHPGQRHARLEYCERICGNAKKERVAGLFGSNKGQGSRGVV